MRFMMWEINGNKEILCLSEVIVEDAVKKWDLHGVWGSPFISVLRYKSSAFTLFCQVTKGSCGPVSCGGKINLVCFLKIKNWAHVTGEMSQCAQTWLVKQLPWVAGKKVKKANKTDGHTATGVFHSGHHFSSSPAVRLLSSHNVSVNMYLTSSVTTLNTWTHIWATAL